MIKINKIIWKETFIKKIESKHHVTMFEVEEILHGRKKVYRIAKGDVKGENVYLALGKTSAGRYLSVFFILKKNHDALPISARDMDNKERRQYGHE
ncbi:MAG: BrnT family toxin [Halobacteriota archaeon]